jgi:hypothetical protein
MANSLALNQSNPIAGLGTFNATIVKAGNYKVGFTTTLPLNSGVQVQVQQNSTPMLTTGGVSTNPTPTQPAFGSSVELTCAANDVVAIVISSSNAADQIPNAVKTVANIYAGF